jgi:hypothetical protein
MTTHSPETTPFTSSRELDYAAYVTQESQTSALQIANIAAKSAMLKMVNACFNHGEQQSVLEVDINATGA